MRQVPDTLELEPAVNIIKHIVAIARHLIEGQQIFAPTSALWGKCPWTHLEDSWLFHHSHSHRITKSDHERPIATHIPNYKPCPYQLILIVFLQIVHGQQQEVQEWYVSKPPRRQRKVDSAAYFAH